MGKSRVASPSLSIGIAHTMCSRLKLSKSLENLAAYRTLRSSLERLGYGSQKRSCLHWVNCKNSCYCAQWSKLLEEESEVKEKV
eukprot:symbB.v1.2.029899.t1/scaffold3318.1/size84623/8